MSVVNPALMQGVSRDYLVYSASDVIAHLIEAYFTATVHPKLPSRLVESLINTVIETTEALRLIRPTMRPDLQEPDATADADPATSEGVFVYTGSAPTVAIGDFVTVISTVSDRQASTYGVVWSSSPSDDQRRLDRQPARRPVAGEYSSAGL